MGNTYSMPAIPSEITGSSSYSGHGAQMACDLKTDSYWMTASGGATSASLDYAFPKPVKPSSLRFYRAGSSYRPTTVYVLSNGIIIATCTIAATTGWQSFDIDTEEEYSSLQFTFTASDNLYLVVDELEIWHEVPYVKADGKRIAVRFDREITGGVDTCSPDTFGVSYQAYDFVPGGALQDKTAAVESVEMSYDLWEAWEQPKLTSNTGYGTVSASSSNAGKPPYLALDGVNGDSAHCWESATNATSGWFKWELPVTLRISSIKLYNKYTGNTRLTKGVAVYADESKTIPIGTPQEFPQQSFSEAVFTPDTPVVTDTVYIDLISSYNLMVGLSNIEITAEYMVGEEDPFVIVLGVDGSERFENAVGDMTVTYDGTGGIRGVGGPVQAFSLIFTPSGLTPKPNQNAAEHIEVSGVTAAGTLTRVDYIEAQTEEHIEVAGISASGTLTHINDI